MLSHGRSGISSGLSCSVPDVLVAMVCAAGPSSAAATVVAAAGEANLAAAAVVAAAVPGKACFALPVVAAPLPLAPAFAGTDFAQVAEAAGVRAGTIFVDDESALEGMLVSCDLDCFETCSFVDRVVSLATEDEDELGICRGNIFCSGTCGCWSSCVEGFLDACGALRGRSTGGRNGFESCLLILLATEDEDELDEEDS